MGLSHGIDVDDLSIKWRAIFAKRRRSELQYVSALRLEDRLERMPSRRFSMMSFVDEQVRAQLRHPDLNFVATLSC